MERPAKPRLVDVAARAGVSAATVSRAISHPDMLRASTLARVSHVIAELGYVRDAAGQALALRRTGTVGVVVPTLSHSIFALAIQAMQTTFAQANYQLLVASHEYSPVIEAAAVRSLMERGVDALLLVGTDHGRDVWTMIEGAAIPVVLTWSLHERLDFIGFDNAAAGRLAAEHLVALGHRRFGLISGHLRNNDRASARLDGIRGVLEAAGLSLPTSCIMEHPFGLAGGRAGMAALLALADPPTAIIGGNDLMAIGAMLEAQSRGLAVPADVSIVGVDDLELAAHVLPGLTTIHLPTSKLGALAADHTLKRLAGETAPARLELPIELVVRGSTGPCGHARHLRAAEVRPKAPSASDRGPH